MKTLPFEPFIGESVIYSGNLGSDYSGEIILTTYRLYARPGIHVSLFYNLPLRLIDYAQLQTDQRYLKIYCRHGYAFSLEFPDHGLVVNCLLELSSAIDYCTFRPQIEFEPFSVPNRNTICLSDYKRLGLTSGAYRVSDVNKNFEVCKSYPEYVCTAATVSNDDLLKSIKFRANDRFVSIVYRHGPNGTCLARSSQPGLGILCYRNFQDEMVLRALANSAHNPVDRSGMNSLNIVDARDNASAYWNRARGGGYEFEEYYMGSKIHFMQIPNIHTIRTAFNAMRDIIGESQNHKGLDEKFSTLDWPRYISMLIESSRFVAESIHQNGTPVLVHCSDGWDRTPQIVSLAKLYLDPYYRTIKGFTVLIETEWVAFGHRFTSRCQSSKDSSERSPIFLQWLDCVHQLLNLYPKCFEFNERLLVKIGLHCYLSLFDTFMAEKHPEENNRGLKKCSDKKQKCSQVDERMTCLWSFLLGREKYLNPNYEGNQNYKVLLPVIPVESCLFWKDMYLHGKCSKKLAKYANAGKTRQNQMCDYWYEENANSQNAEEFNVSLTQSTQNLSSGSQSNGVSHPPCRLNRRNSDSVLVWAESPTGNQDVDFLPSRSPFELIDLDRALYGSKSEQCISLDMSPNTSCCEEVRTMARSVLSLLDSVDKDWNVESLRQKLQACLAREERTVRSSPIDVDGLLDTPISDRFDQCSQKYFSLKARNHVLENAVQSLCEGLMKLLKDKDENVPKSNQQLTTPLSSMSVEEDNECKLGKSGECSKCGNKLRWILKPRQRCRLCYRTFCKSCCDNVVTLAASPTDPRRKIETSADESNLVQLAFRICEKCIKLYAGRHLKPLSVNM